MPRLSAISKAKISSTQWDELDFEDIETSIAHNLTDDDVSAVLQCIDAKQTLKKLKLAGCVNITGRSLQPLQELVYITTDRYQPLGKKHDSQRNVQEFLLSREIVMPILHSVIVSAGCSLKYVTFSIGNGV